MLKAVSDWIGNYYTAFRVASTQEGENMTRYRFDPDDGP